MVTVATRERAEPRLQFLFGGPEREPNKSLDDTIEVVVQRLREIQARAKLAQTHQNQAVKIEQLEAMGIETNEAAKAIQEAVKLAKAGEDAQ